MIFSDAILIYLQYYVVNFEFSCGLFRCGSFLCGSCLGCLLLEAGVKAALVNNSLDNARERCDGRLECAEYICEKYVSCGQLGERYDSIHVYNSAVKIT